jgi:membrane protein
VRPLRSPHLAVARLVVKTYHDRIDGLAAEVAFFAVLSVFPALLTLAAALGSLQVLTGEGFARAAEQTIIDFLSAVLTQRASGAVNAVRQLFSGQHGAALVAGVLLAVTSLTRAFRAVITALDLAYGLTEHRPWLKLQGLGLVFAIGSFVISLFCLAALVAGPLLGAGPDLSGGAGGRVWTYVRYPFVFGVLLLWCTTLYHLAPNHSERTPWRWEVPGALLAAALWLAASAGLSLYLHVAAGSNAVLSVLGGGLTLLVWLYWLSVALLVGGELNSLLAPVFEGRKSAGP